MGKRRAASSNAFSAAAPSMRFVGSAACALSTRGGRCAADRSGRHRPAPPARTDAGRARSSPSLCRATKPFDGAVLLLEPARAIVVRVNDGTLAPVDPRSVADAVELGYHAGNLHWRVRFQGDCLLVALAGAGRRLSGPAWLRWWRNTASPPSSRMSPEATPHRGVAVLTMLHAIWQADSAFPSGSFAFSGGLEGLVGARPAHRPRGTGGADAGRAACAAGRAPTAWPLPAPTARPATSTALSPRTEACRCEPSLPHPCAKVRAATALPSLPPTRASASPQRNACSERAPRGCCPGICRSCKARSVLRIGMDAAAAIAAAGYAAMAALATASVRLGAHRRDRRAVGRSRIVLPLLAALAADPPPEDAPIEAFSRC